MSRATIINLPKTTLDVASCNSKEWLETNGTGSYASSTLLNCHTRKYHGLLVAQLMQPYGNFVLLSKFDEHLLTEKKAYPLIMHRYLNYTDAAAFDYLDAFEINTQSCVRYQCDHIKLSREMLLLPEKNTLLIRYCIEKPSPSLQLSLRPFLAYRRFDTLSKANNAVNNKAQYLEKAVLFSPYQGMPDLTISHAHSLQWIEESYWYYQFEYTKEKARGYDYLEDLFSPGVMKIPFNNRTEIIVACSIESVIENDLTALWQDEIDRRKQLTKTIAEKISLPKSLEGFTNLLQSRAAPQLLIRTTESNPSIIAGYHWFGEWGRDAMISLPGLTLYSGQEDLCLKVLTYFASHEYQGIIPNRIAPLANGTDEYDTVDASVWFCRAAQQYLSTQNLSGIKKFLWKTIKNIIHFYCIGTLCDIKKANDGLIYAGNPRIKTTWMDVMINGIPLTPRNGAQVEVNALWYNALCFAYFLAQEFHDPIANTIQPLVTLVKESFTRVFWNPKMGYLYDFVNERESNAQIRPNQIFAVALPYSLLEPSIEKQIVDTVKTHLLTPYGLRTLSPDDPQYCPNIIGDQNERDKAYHNGTVWPWLLGAFTEALLKTEENASKQKTKRFLRDHCNKLCQHATTQIGLGCVSEIFDGSLPHHPRGCIQQAWSVAELIRMVHLLQ